MYTIFLKRWTPGKGYKQPEILERTEQITTAVLWYQEYLASGQKPDLKPGEGALIEFYIKNIKILYRAVKRLKTA